MSTFVSLSERCAEKGSGPVCIVPCNRSGLVADESRETEIGTDFFSEVFKLILPFDLGAET